MDFHLANGTGQQRAWFETAIGLCRFPYTRARQSISDYTVEVTWVDEPSAPGHKDYMCANIVAGVPHIEIRHTADDANIFKPPGPLQNFYMESVVHETMHVFWMMHYNDDVAKAKLASMFRYETSPARVGVLADWNPLDRPWEERVQEAVAEFSKDVYLAESVRVYDNRTSWAFDETRFAEWLKMIEDVTCLGAGV